MGYKYNETEWKCSDVKTKISLRFCRQGNEDSAINVGLLVHFENFMDGKMIDFSIEYPMILCYQVVKGVAIESLEQTPTEIASRKIRNIKCLFMCKFL